MMYSTGRRALLSFVYGVWRVEFCGKSVMVGIRCFCLKIWAWFFRSCSPTDLEREADSLSPSFCFFFSLSNAKSNLSHPLPSHPASSASLIFLLLGSHPTRLALSLPCSTPTSTLFLHHPPPPPSPPPRPPHHLHHHPRHHHSRCHRRQHHECQLTSQALDQWLHEHDADGADSASHEVIECGGGGGGRRWKEIEEEGGVYVEDGGCGE